MTDPYRRRSPDGFDDDAIFAEIVAHLNDPSADEPAAEDQGPIRPAPEEAHTETQRPLPLQPADAAPAEPTQPPTPERPQGNLDQGSVEKPGEEPETSTSDPKDFSPPQVWRAPGVEEEDDQHFEPPPATPLPAGDLQFWAILAGMGGGPLLLLYLVFFNREASGYWILIAIALAVGGFALLVSRMPGHHEDDDDGARL